MDKWYNKIMSKIVSADTKNNASTGIPMQNKKNINENFSSNESNLDINLIIVSFQEKLTQIMTELVVKEAKIKQLTAIIERQKGHQDE